VKSVIQQLQAYKIHLQHLPGLLMMHAMLDHHHHLVSQGLILLLNVLENLKSTEEENIFSQLLLLMVQDFPLTEMLSLKTGVITDAEEERDSSSLLKDGIMLSLSTSTTPEQVA